MSKASLPSPTVTYKTFKRNLLIHKIITLQSSVFHSRQADRQTSNVCRISDVLRMNSRNDRPHPCIPDPQPPYLDFHTHLNDIMLRGVVLVAVGEHQPHISGKLRSTVVLTILKLFLWKTSESNTVKWRTYVWDLFTRIMQVKRRLHNFYRAIHYNTCTKC